MPARDQTLEQLAAVIGDKYEVLQWIGGGGMAEVFLARHRVHGGLAAVKVLADQLSRDPVIVERFLQEARTAAALSGHANIVTIFDVGESQGLYYLIMQYIEGEDLGEYLARQGRLEAGEAARILTQVTQALVWAHARGVVHRDLKPGNIRMDQSGRVIVLDFGIAKAGSAPTALTTFGEKLGTPLYMPPEQIRGEVCDGRTDLYALGLVFFELLTGQRPFGGDTYYEMEQAQMHTPAPAPEGVEARVAEVVLRLLEKDPGARYQSAEELLEALKDLEAGRAPEPAPRPRPPVREAPPRGGGGVNRTWLVFGAGAAVIAVAVGLAFWAQKPVASGQPPVSSGRKAPETRIQTPTGAMMLVAGGEFTFGDQAKESPNPTRTVSLPEYYVDATEVSNAAYRQFAEATGRPLPDTVGGPDYPVVNVTLLEARAYAEWAGKRLPTEEEWEKAARGTDGRKYPWGNTPPESGRANLGSGSAVAVEALPDGASPYGAKNMAGNVWEWTVSAYPVSAAEVADMQKVLPSVGNLWNVIKGGSYAPQTIELFARTYMRRGFPVTGTSPYIGFRCVRDAK